jgi:nicotinamidase/pyrazinamidase
MKTVFVDVDTQLDFLVPGGALYVKDAEKLIPKLAALTRHAEKQAIPIIATLDSHSENDPEFRVWPHHCVVGTLGQRKPEVLQSKMQTYVAKQVLDPFATPELEHALTRLGAERCVVYGVVTEICVQLAAAGLVRSGRTVELVTDAIKELDAARGAQVCRDLSELGVRFTTVDQILRES